ncbi:MAG: hypothetical protein M5U26_27650 [Planctomycetota bacterium]|nr:hypothetical protein [Planctomycetota bacterium]
MRPRLVLILVPVLLAAGALWWLRASRAPGDPLEDLEPGAEVTVVLGRAGLAVDGDAADALAGIRVTHEGAELALEGSWVWPDGSRAVLFFDVAPRPLEVAIQTAHRSHAERIEAGREPLPLLLRTVDLRLPETFAPDAVPPTALAFSPDGKRIAIASAGGEVILEPSIGGARALDLGLEPRRAPGLAFAGDGGILVVGIDGMPPRLEGYEAASGVKLWAAVLEDSLWSLQAEAAPPGDPVTRSLRRLLPLHEKDEVLAVLESPASGKLLRVQALRGNPLWHHPPDRPGDARWIYALDSSPGAAAFVAAMGRAKLPVGFELFFQRKDGGGSWENAEFMTLSGTDSIPEHGFAMSADGASITIGTREGELRCFRRDGGSWKGLWRERLGAWEGPSPRQGAAVAVRCGARSAYVAWEDRPAPAEAGGQPAPGPRTGLLSAYGTLDPAPDLKWARALPGLPRGLWLDPAGRWLAAAWMRPAGMDDFGRATPPAFGLSMFDLEREGEGEKEFKPLWTLATRGPLGAEGAFSPDGRYLAVVEGPAPTDDPEQPERVYRVLILH